MQYFKNYGYFTQIMQKLEKKYGIILRKNHGYFPILKIYVKENTDLFSKCPMIYPEQLV